MGRRLRQIKKHAVYETVQGIVDRQFMLKPDHYKSDHTLSTMCPRDSLDQRNNHTPIPSTLNIIGAAIGRALRQVPVNLHCFESNIKHKHSVEANVTMLDLSSAGEANSNMQPPRTNIL